MLDKVKWVSIETQNYKTLLPIHKRLVNDFPYLKKELSKRLLASQKVWRTLWEVNRSIHEILSHDPSTDVPTTAVKYSWKVIQIIQELSRNNNLFYKDLPAWWDQYLLDAVEEIVCSMKNKDFIINMFQIAIEDVKQWKKVNFSDIYKDAPDKASYKYELAKIHHQLKEKYNIDFVWIGGSGSVLKIWNFVEKNDVIDNAQEIQKALIRMKDYNAVSLNRVIESFWMFITDVVEKRHLNEFQPHELTVFCLKLFPDEEIWLVRTLIKKVFKNLLEQWIIVRKKSKINFEIKVNKIANNFYNLRYFPILPKNSEFEKVIGDIEQKTAKKNASYIRALMTEMLSFHSKSEFFVLSRFMEKSWFSEDKTLYYNRILIKLIQKWVIGRKWRERYYICNWLQNQSHDQDRTDLLSLTYLLERYDVQWKNNTLKTKILYYIFKDLSSIWLSLEDIKDTDLKFRLEENDIYIEFQNFHFIKFSSQLSHIADEIWEKKWFTIHVSFKNEYVS